MDVVKVRSEIRKTVFDELLAFFKQLVGREQRKVITQDDLELAFAKVGVALEEKLDITQGSETANAAQGELRSFFSRLSAGKAKFVLDSEEFDAVIDNAAGAVEQKVLQEVEGSNPSFIDAIIRRALVSAGISNDRSTAATPEGSASAAIGRLKRAGAWSPAFDIVMPEILESLASSAKAVRFSDGKTQSPLTAMETFLEWLARNVSPDQLRAAALSARGVNFAEISGISPGSRIGVNPVSVLRARRADSIVLEAAKQGKTIDYGEALRIVAEEDRVTTLEVHPPQNIDPASLQAANRAARIQLNARKLGQTIDYGEALRLASEEVRLEGS